MKTVIFQHGYEVIGEGEDLFTAHEDAQQWADDLPAYGDIEMFEAVQSPVDGRVYWTADAGTIKGLDGE